MELSLTHTHTHTHTTQHNTHTHTALNEEQIELNKERAALFEAAIGGKALPTAMVMNESPALLEWQGGDRVPTEFVTAAPAASASGANSKDSGALSKNSLKPQTSPAGETSSENQYEKTRKWLLASRTTL